jgi:PAS domain S-box-containing protein
MKLLLTDRNIWLIASLFFICIAVQYVDLLVIHINLPVEVFIKSNWYLYTVAQIIFLSTDKIAAVLEVCIILSVGVIACLWSVARERERQGYQQLAGSLAKTQEKLKVQIRDASDNAKRLATINKISTALSQSLDPRTILDTAVSLLVEAMEVEIILFYSCYEKAGKLILMAYKGITEEVAREIDDIRLGEGFSGYAAETGEVMIVPNTADQSTQTKVTDGGLQISSQVIVPMKSKGRIIGTICIGMHNPRHFLTEEIDLLNTIAGQIASALENAYLYDEARLIADKLYKSERDYRTLFENAHDAIWFHNFDGTMLAANEATVQLTGYNVDTLIGMNVSQFLSDSGLHTAKMIRKKLLAGEKIQQPYEQKLTKKDGTSATIMLASSLITFDGKPVGYQHIARDITDEKRMQDNLRFYLKQITQAQEEERKRIARELHDDTAQYLFAISRQIDNYIRSDGSVKKQQLTFLQEIRQRVGDTLQGVRRFSQDLRPSIIDDLGLMPAVQWLVKKVQDEQNIKGELIVIGDERRFAPEVELILFRVIQEALSNIYRHACATKAEVVIEFKKSSVYIMISDDGEGFKIPKNFSDFSSSGKLGLLGMNERVLLLNGSIDINSVPRKGTVVKIKVPV